MRPKLPRTGTLTRNRSPSLGKRRAIAPPSHCHIDVLDDTDALTISLTGELDIASVPELQAEVRRVTGRHRTVIIDLSQVSFVDSSAIRLLSDLRRGPWGDRLALVPPPDAVAHLFDLVGVRSDFRWLGSPASAVADEHKPAQPPTLRHRAQG